MGNDLPPRHASNQTELNLDFILNNEPDFPSCEKVWILNRIVDRQKCVRLTEQLHEAGHRAVTIEFNRKDYEATCNGKTIDEKVRSIVGINDARNRAIEVGRNQGSRWILPFDGNCIFSQHGWRNLVADLEAIGDKYVYLQHRRPRLRNLGTGKSIRRNPKVFFVPMFRLQENDEFAELKDVTPPGNEQEPQVVLRSDCQLRFDTTVGYGNDDKVEFLRRTGNRIRYHGHGYVPVDRKVCVGYVYRLASGDEAADADINVRARLRQQAMEFLVKSVDETKTS